MISTPPSDYRPPLAGTAAAARCLLVLWVLLLFGCAQKPLPPLQPPLAKKCASTPNWYRVKSGDTLFHIGWAYCLNYLDIAKWNKLRNPDRIRVGQRLRLRPAVGQPSRAAPQRTVGTASQRSAAATRQRTAAAKPQPRVAPSKPSPTPASKPQQGWNWPAQGKIVSKFAAGVPGRNGIRISVAQNRSIRAASPGQIVYTGDSLPGYGTLIIVEHSGGLLSAYGNLGKLLVKKGDRVSAGDIIAELNGTANNTLHFEIRKDGQPVNPLGYLPS